MRTDAELRLNGVRALIQALGDGRSTIAKLMKVNR